MWTKRYLAVCILLASALPPAAPTTALAESAGFGSLSTQGLSKSFSSLMGSIGSALAPLTDRTSSDDVEVFYKEVFNSMKKMEWNPCVRRLCKGEEMKVWDMRLSFAQKDISMKVDNVVRGSDNLGLVVAPVSFTFPSHMILSAKFKYEGTVMMVPYIKQGDAEFEVGPVTVTVKAKLPDTKTAIKQVPNNMECQYRMSPNSVVTAASEKFEVAKVNYKSMTGRDYSKTYIIESFKKMKNDIISNLSTYLESHVVQVVQKVMFSCLDADAQKKWAPPSATADCAKETCD